MKNPWSGENLRQNRTSGRPEAARFPPQEIANRALEIPVLYTTHAATLAALETAARLAANLDARPTVLIFYAMPLTLPLEGRLVPPGFLERRVQALAQESPVEFSVHIYLCRYPQRSLRQLLPPHSLIAIGGRKRWWPTAEQWLAWRLRKDGHEVVFADVG